MDNNIKITILCSIILIFSCSNQSTIKQSNNNWTHDSIQVSDSRFEIFTMYNGLKHGEAKVFDKQYGLVEKKLFLENKLLVNEVYGGDSIDMGYTYFYYLNDIYYPIGSLFYNRESYKKNQIACTYFEVEASDTIKHPNPYKVKITSNIGLKTNYNIQLSLGKLDTLYQLDDIQALYISKGQELEFEITEYNKGINLITGVISYFENGKDITTAYRMSEIDVPLVFYVQFVAM